MSSYVPIAERPLPEQATFLAVVVGMIKEAGYTRASFVEAMNFAWQHVHGPNDSEIKR